jgi:rsbT co-antagonist protein RsbR
MTDAALQSEVAALRQLLDVYERASIEQSEVLEKANSELRQGQEERQELIERLRLAIEDLSTPILELWESVLALPVIGVVDSKRSAEMTERLLAEVVARQARFVIVDLTGVELIDTKTADHFVKMVRAVELVGASCMVSGIRPAVAQTLVELGIDFANLKTLGNLRHALAQAIRSLSEAGSAPH